MSELECFSCDRRQLCEPIISETVVLGITAAAQMDFSETDFNPMDAVRMFNALGEVASSGDASKLVELTSATDLQKTSPENIDIMEQGYSKLKAAGCSLDDKAFGVRMAQYINGNLLNIISKVIEEEMVQELTNQVDDENRLKGALDEADTEISGILAEMEKVASEDPEVSGLIDGSMTELDRILTEIRSVVGDTEQASSITERPKRQSLEERKIEERLKFIESQGWDDSNLDFSQKLEVKSHLRKLGLIS